MSFLDYRKRKELRTALCLLSLALLFLIAWTPYAIVSAIGQFGPLDEDGQVRWLSPLAISIPAFFAKSAIIFNPLVYGFSHPKFPARRILRDMGISTRERTTMIPMSRMANNPRRQSRSLVIPAATPSSFSGRERIAVQRNSVSSANPQFLLNWLDVSGSRQQLRRGTVLHLPYAIREVRN